MSIVLDEYGGVSGLITLQDLIEELVGDLQEDEQDITALEDGSFRILGSASVQDVAKALQTEIDPDLISFNGMIYDLLQDVPKNASHQVIPFENYEIILENVSNHRVESAIVRKAEIELQPESE